jgi:hypothetical protein
VSAQTLLYLYNQRQLVVLLQPTASGQRRYEQVYAKTLTINRGVDNLLEFAFVNQEQKPVNITGQDITCRILNYNGTEVLIQKTLTPILALKGITSLILTKDDIENIPQQYCYYSLEIPVNGFDFPVFVDADGGARGQINIVNSVLPSFVPAQLITIPSQIPPTIGESRTNYSSIIYTADSSVLTTQTFLDNFAGTIQWQGSTQQDFAYYYDIGAEIEYSESFTGNRGDTILGYHPFVRLKIVNVGSPPSARNGDLSGNVTGIYAR